MFVSLASEPELVKKTCVNCFGEILTRRSASSAAGALLHWKKLL